jgi:hypothetical protein
LLLRFRFKKKVKKEPESCPKITQKKPEIPKEKGMKYKLEAIRV